jgi:hypothetical protein
MDRAVVYPRILYRSSSFRDARSADPEARNQRAALCRPGFRVRCSALPRNDDGLLRP